jgi:adenine-specific DNA-methyltransferase
MPRLLQLADVTNTDTPEKVAKLFQMLGYRVPLTAQPLSIKDLELPTKSAEAIWNAYLIADHSKGASSLQVLLFHLNESEWETPSAASNRMRSIAHSLCHRPSNFLLLGTKNYDQLMLVNPRKTFDAQMNLRVGIRKLLIDRIKPTNYDRDRLEAIAAHNLDPEALYKVQCEAFDVEKLTKDFYKGYRELFNHVQQAVLEYNPHPYFDDSGRLHQFSQRLLGRVMFLYFLQKKGFLAGDRDFLKSQYKKMSCDLPDADFYKDLLEELFFNTLNYERPNHESPWGKIPYLNGGLFEKDYGGHQDAAGWVTPETITLPNSLFEPGGEKGILKFFSNYNFTISENIEGDEDVAVDPEMLGKVFENMLAADERGQSGTFYTPRGIVQFMCVESLSRYLTDESGMDLEAVRKLTEYSAEVSDAEVNKLLTKDQAKRLKKALESVKICDPAVGSGAFPLGMMQVILTVKQAIARREGITVQRGSLALSEWKREIIGNNLYGVDIKPEAVEIAKLRMWLSMVVDIPTIDDVEPLPNLDYKMMAGNSLISRIYGEQMIPEPIPNKQLKLAVTPTQEAIEALSVLQQRYFDASVDERKVLRDEISEAQQNVFRIEIVYRRQGLQTRQRNLQAEIKSCGGRASSIQLKKQAEIDTKLKQLDQIQAQVERGVRSLDFFQWHLHFNEVFKQKGGFDIVLGNPPYVRQEKLSEQFKESLKIAFPELHKGTADVYTYFYGKGIELLRTDGQLAFITPNKWFRASYGNNLRRYMSANCYVNSITDFGELPVFDAATFPMILIAKKGASDKEKTLFTQVKSLDIPYPNVAMIVENQGQYLPLEAIRGEDWNLNISNSATCLKRIESESVSLSSYITTKILRGLVTGFNKAFVIDATTRAELISSSSESSEIIKPLTVGNSIRKWQVVSEDKWIIVTPIGINIQRYPAVFEHLMQWKSELQKRCDKGNHWWEFRACDYYSAFESSKILFPDIAKESRFTLDIAGYYTTNSAYFIPSTDLYLLGVLNSSIVWCYCKQNLAVLGDAEKGGRLRFFRQFVEKIPVPSVSLGERRVISALVQKCLNAQGHGVADWEAEINDRVAHLYGLTAEDMKIIEGGN